MHGFRQQPTPAKRGGPRRAPSGFWNSLPTLAARRRKADLVTGFNIFCGKQNAPSDWFVNVRWSRSSFLFSTTNGDRMPSKFVPWLAGTDLQSILFPPPHLKKSLLHEPLLPPVVTGCVRSINVYAQAHSRINWTAPVGHASPSPLDSHIPRSFGSCQLASDPGA